MGKIKTQCPICAQVEKTKEVPTSCFQCGADYTNPGVEFVINRAAHTAWGKGSVGGSQGTLVLTNLRLFWIADGPTGAGAAIGGALGALMETAMTGGAGMRMCIPLSDILTLDDAKAGLAKVVQITSRSEGVIGRFSTHKQNDQWKAAILNAVAQYGQQPPPPQPGPAPQP